jgi:hypothetical protein
MVWLQLMPSERDHGRDHCGEKKEGGEVERWEEMWRTRMRGTMGMDDGLAADAASAFTRHFKIE